MSISAEPYIQYRCQHGTEIDSGTQCTRPAFIRCAHCGRILCLHHLLSRECFHETGGPRAGPSHEREPASRVNEAWLFDDTAMDNFDEIVAAESRVENFEQAASDIGGDHHDELI